MEKERRKMSDFNGESEFLNGGLIMESTTPSRSLFTLPSPTSPAVNGGANCIVHTVSKYDTLAGVAIKYGVEVADIKRLNGLVTDLQMFALKTLQIPLPGRHPPSSSLSDPQRYYICGVETTSCSKRRLHVVDPECLPFSPDSIYDEALPSMSEPTPSSRRHSDFFDSFQSLKLTSSSERKVSPAMSSLRGYYGLKPSDQNPPSEGFEMALYGEGGAHNIKNKPISLSNPPLAHHRKSKSVANGLGRRQKSEVDFTYRTPEKLLKEETSSSSAISAVTGKRLALRPKSASRTTSGGIDSEGGAPSPTPVGFGDTLTESLHGVRKSSSTSSLQDSENGALSSLWSASWNLKPDFQALSTAAIARPIFDGLPKPTGRRNKTAVD